MVIIMTVFILLAFFLVAAACFMIISKFGRIDIKTPPRDSAQKISIALEDISAAASLYEKLEAVSEKYPHIQFCFYTGSAHDIIRLSQCKKIDFGIISSKPSAGDLHWAAVSLKKKNTAVTGYDITVEPLCPCSADFYIIFSPEMSEDIKNEVIQAIASDAI